MRWRERPGEGPQQNGDGENRKRHGARRFADRTDYGQRHFVNLVATAFILALAIGMGLTMRAFDQQRSLERCLDSGRKECRQVGNSGVRSYVALPK